MSTENDDNREAQSPAGPDAPAQIEATVTPTRQRSRCRVAITTLTAGVLIAGTIIGIQQLSGTRDDSPNLAVPPTPAPEASSSTSASTVPETSDAVTATTVSGWSPSSDGTDPTMAFLESKATPAQAVPANISWTVLDANSPEALAYRFDSTQRYALATVPATSPDQMDKLGLFEQVNGSWSQVPFEDPEGLEPIMSGDTIYGIGSAPATPGGPVGSFGTFDVASGTWRLHELPDQAAPYESDALTSNLYFQAAPIDDGLIVAVSSWSDFRSDKQREMFRSFETAPIVDGDSIVAFKDCDHVAMDAAVGEGILTRNNYLELFRKYCTVVSFDPSEIGLTQADLGALERSRTGAGGIPLWKVTADSMVPFDVPGFRTDDPTNYVSLNGKEIVVSGTDPNSPTTIYQIGHDGSLHQVFKDLADDVLRYGVTSIASPDYSTVIGGVDRYLLMERSGGPTQITDALSAITTPDMVHPYANLTAAGTLGELSVFGASVGYDPAGTLSEPTSLSDSGYTLKLNDSQGGSYDLIEDATGEPPQFDYGLSTESGKVQVTRYPGPPPPSDDSQAASMIDDSTVVATFDIDWRTVPGLNMKWRFNVLTTTDGVNVAASDIETTLRQSVNIAENDTVNFGDVKVIDGRILVSSSVYASVESVDSSDGPDFDTERRYLVVGTPN